MLKTYSICNSPKKLTFDKHSSGKQGWVEWRRFRTMSGPLKKNITVFSWGQIKVKMHWICRHDEKFTYNFAT
jgi:hypothetical protein